MRTLPTLHRDTLLAELCRCMLRAGALHALPPYLHMHGLPAEKAEQLVLTAARHHFYSATALDSEDVGLGAGFFFFPVFLGFFFGFFFLFGWGRGAGRGRWGVSRCSQLWGCT